MAGSILLIAELCLWTGPQLKLYQANANDSLKDVKSLILCQCMCVYCIMCLELYTAQWCKQTNWWNNSIILTILECVSCRALIITGLIVRLSIRIITLLRMEQDKDLWVHYYISKNYCALWVSHSFLSVLKRNLKVYNIAGTINVNIIVPLKYLKCMSVVQVSLIYCCAVNLILMCQWTTVWKHISIFPQNPI